MKVCEIRQCELCGDEFRTDNFKRRTELKTLKDETFQLMITTPLFQETWKVSCYVDVCPSCLRAETLKILEGWKVDKLLECQICKGTGKHDGPEHTGDAPGTCWLCKGSGFAEPLDSNWEKVPGCDGAWTRTIEEAGHGTGKEPQ